MGQAASWGKCTCNHVDEKAGLEYDDNNSDSQSDNNSSNSASRSRRTGSSYKKGRSKNR